MDWLVAFFKSVVLVYFMAMAWFIALSLMKIANFIDRFSLRTVVLKRHEEDGEESSHTTEEKDVIQR